MSGHHYAARVGADGAASPCRRSGRAAGAAPEAIVGSCIRRSPWSTTCRRCTTRPSTRASRTTFARLCPVSSSSRAIVADSESIRRDVVQSYGVAPDKAARSTRATTPTYLCPGRRASACRRHQRLRRPLRGQPLPAQEPPVPPRRLRHLRRRQPVRLCDQGRWPARLRLRRAPARRDPRARDAVSLQGYAAEGQLRDLYAGAACLALPSLREGFRPARARGDGRGTPVVTSASSSLPEVGGDAALRVDPTTPSTSPTRIYRAPTETAPARGPHRARAQWARDSAGGGRRSRCRA